MSTEDDTYKLTEADRPSDTRFGPRPVPEGHKTGAANHARRSQRVIPSAPMSPDGRSAYPSPSLSTKIVVWGGVALGVAGATAGALMAARKVAGMIADDKPQPPRRQYAPQHQKVAPRFADLDEEARDEMRSRVRAQARADDRDAARLRAEASRRRQKPRRNFARDLTDTANGLSRGLEGVSQSLSSAFTGFRSVAAQATGIVGEFAAAADQLRSVLRGSDAPKPEADRSDRAQSYDDIRREEERTHRL